MLSFPEFRADRTAQDAHSALRKSLDGIERAQHCALLWFGEIMRRGLYRELGYSSMQTYSIEELGFSVGKARDFVRLAGKLEELPHLKESVEEGKVGYTKVSEVVKVATSRTEKQWVEEAIGSSGKMLAEKVARVKKKAQVRRKNPAQAELLPTARVETKLVREVPVRVSLEMSPEQFVRYELLWEKLHKLGGVPASSNKVEELLEALAGRVVARVVELEAGTLNDVTSSNQGNNATPAPRGAGIERVPSFQIHIHKCPNCERATVQTSAGEKQISNAERERIECDAVVMRPGHQARSTIPPKTRRDVLARDRHRCQGPGCTNTRFLEIHHKRPASKGGSNEPSNLITLCGACHRLVHERLVHEHPTSRVASNCDKPNHT